ncbi:MAG: DegT/DnrJ/EryC1/StrS family aminotransferase [Ilumatobacteraceae bacterium]
MRTTFLPFSPPAIGEEEIAAVVDALRSDWITTGPRVQELESAFAARVGVPDALAVSSCTDAMQVALAALGVGPGDAVLTSPLTFCATAHVAEHLGARPLFVDIDPTSLNLDPAGIEPVLAEARAAGLVPKVLLPVHHSGQPCDLDAIVEIAEHHRLAVVEDAAHALPATWRGRMIGDVGGATVPRAVAFSFYATKNVTTAEGGMLTATPDLLDEARLWALHGMSRDAWKRYGRGGSWYYEVVRPGFKCNMTDMAAAMGLVQLRRLDELQERRHKVVARYDAAFAEAPEALELPSRRADVEHAWHLYVLRLHLDRLTIDRDQFITELARRNIAASVHFIPLHLQPFYRDKYRLAPGDLPLATGEYARIVSLPLHPRLDDGDVDDVIEAVLDVAATYRR